MLLMNGMGGIQSDMIKFILENEDVDNYDIFITKAKIYFSNLLRSGD